MAFKVTLSNYSDPQGRGASFWVAGSSQMASLAQPWISNEDGDNYYVTIDLMKTGSGIPLWEWTGFIPIDGHQYTLDVGNSNLIDNGPLSGGNPPIIVHFNADTYIFQNDTGGLVMLYWGVTGATSVSIDQGVGSVSPEGQLQTPVTQTKTFTLTASNSYGTVSAQITIQVVGAPVPETGQPIILSFSSTPNPVQKGQAAELYWNVDPNGLATSVSISGIGSVANTGTRQLPNRQATQVYTLTATNSKGTSIYQLTVTVINVITFFVATPAQILPGESSTLSWEVTGSQNYIGIDGIGSVAATGSREVTPGSTTTYLLRVSGPQGDVTAEAKVTVGSTGGEISAMPWGWIAAGVAVVGALFLLGKKK